MFFYPYNFFLNRFNIFLAVFIIKKNRSNGKSLQPNKTGGEMDKKNKKSASKDTPTSPDLSWGCVLEVKGWLGGIERWKGRSVG